MKPLFDDDTMYAALEDAGGGAVAAAAAVGCSPATMFAFKRRVAWVAAVRGPAPTTPHVTPTPRPEPEPTRPAESVTVASVHTMTGAGVVDAADFDILCNDLPPVPDPVPHWIEREYWGRFVKRLDQGRTVQLIGHAGSGKTMSPRQYAAERGFPFLRVSLENSADLRKKFGSIQVITRNGASATVFVGAQLLALCEAESIPGAVVLFDEINMVDGNRLAVMNEILDSRTYYLQEARGGRGRSIRIPDSVRLVGACNPPLAQFVGAQRENAALANRFSAHIEVPPLDKGEIRRLAVAFGCPKAMLEDVVRVFGDAQGMVIKQGLRVQVSVRNLEGIVRDLQDGITLREAVTESITNACIGTGDSTGREALSGLFRTLIKN